MTDMWLLLASAEMRCAGAALVITMIWSWRDHPTSQPPVVSRCHVTRIKSCVRSICGDGVSMSAFSLSVVSFRASSVLVPSFREGSESGSSSASLSDRASAMRACCAESFRPGVFISAMYSDPLLLSKWALPSMSSCDLRSADLVLAYENVTALGIAH